MKLKNLLKALFFREEKPVGLDLSAAEIREGKAYLHPKNEPGITYLVRSNNIEILLNKGSSLAAKDVIRIDNAKIPKKATNTPNAESKTVRIPKSKTSAGTTTGSSTAEDPFGKYKKRQFSISLYPDEYTALMDHMKSYGYKRADFILACVNTATKGTMEREHKKILKTHIELRKEEKALHTQHNAVSK